MNLAEFFQRAIRYGIAYDPRKKQALKRIKNPYSDSLILYGDLKSPVKKILVGIDIEVEEILLADRIKQNGGLDLIVSHHPEGKALANLYRVMELHTQILSRVGVSEKIARALMEERIRQVERKLLSLNHLRTVDVAKLLKIPFVCLHTPADNLATYFIKKLMQEKKPKYLKDVLEILEEVPEYNLAKKESVGPRLLLGNPFSKVGKIFVEMTGGTEGSKDIFSYLYRKGIRTLICMHLSEEHFQKVKDINLNVIIAGHISSDTLGLNLLLDRIDAGSNLEIIECSGFRRISHR
ncbi:MAG: NGG1p interacting factor NIF3 [Candidatus Omnitrophica bacterium]|nr:NGG1p interacting factor NIF3 [Candidatus Omnitrophota bacterium]